MNFRNALKWFALGAPIVFALALSIQLYAQSRFMPTLATPTTIVKTVADAAVPERLVATQDQYFFFRATILGKKAARTNNTGIVYLGTVTGNTNVSGLTNDRQPYEITSGDVHTIIDTSGRGLDLYDFVLDVATAGDGVVIIYE